MIAKPSETSKLDEPILVPPPLPCRNCGHAIHLNYCPNCGQHAKDHNTRLWHFIAEFTEEFVRLDSKFLRTVIPLVSKPGFLTQEWVKGKRVRYITPLKIYVTLSAIAFLIISMKINVGNKSLDSLGVHVNSNSDLSGLMDDPTDSPFVHFMKQSALAMNRVNAKTLMDHFISHLPTASFMMVPIAALMFSFLYIRRNRYYVEHLVFTLHYSAFSFLMLALAFVIPWNLIGLIAYIWVVTYLFLAMKRNYAQGWIKTFIKFGLFGFSYSMLVIFVLTGTALVSAYLARDSQLPAGEPKPANASSSHSSHEDKKDVTKPSATPPLTLH